ncbi:alpha/beta hydrolase-fold protein [Micromonospora sp. NBRC 101691]|uniref:alpha/beta hydrolase-fold protein n=1 Tax=Micromonospora sp. NBRC 101691 TaxID=3032198 RepID=UPI002553EC12|nr:alpha/beta hydrolase-fold protein [Micromonospora sp. NBRC 101691]
MPPTPPRTTPTRRLRQGLTVSLAAGLAVTAGAVTAPAATAAPAPDLGPKVVHTNQAPTGNSVTFRYQAPAGVESVQIYGEWWFSKAESVTCQGCGDARPGGQWQPDDILADPWRALPMEKGTDGVWTFTTPLPSGTFRYAFTHDCTSPTASGCTLHPDPANPLEVLPHAEATGARLSRVYVPNSRRFPTYDNDYQAPVAANRAGKLEQRWYDSPLSTSPVGKHDIVVYLPHGYDPNRSTPYPTLYLSHGGGGNATDWTVEGVAHQILENAVRDRAAQPMVIVSTDFNGLPNGNQGYVDELRDNVIPFVEQNYHVSTRATDRAFGGLSAGGARAITLLYDNTDLVGYHAAWGAAGGSVTPTQEQIDRMKAVTGGIHVGTGLQDWLANIAPNSLARTENWRAAGIDVTEHNVDGVHVWDIWRQMLNDYLRTVAFRTTTTSLEVDTTSAGNSHRTRVTATAEVDPVTTSDRAATGKVDFYTGDKYLGSAPVRDGVAQFKGTVSGDLGQPVTARYQGDSLYNASVSAAVNAG